MSRVVSFLAVVGFLVLAGGCAYRGYGDIAATHKFTWYSYLNGDDIREACASGGRDQFRLVYNADYDKQLRSYEVMSDGVGGGRLIARALAGSGIQLQRFSVHEPLALGGWTKAEAALTDRQYGTLMSAVLASGADMPAPRGLRLYSDQYYWVSSLCRQGRFYFNAWLYPSKGYAGLRFPERLYALDLTEVPVAAPQYVGPAQRLKGAPKGSQPNSIFQIHVGNNGLVGLAGI